MEDELPFKETLLRVEGPKINCFQGEPPDPRAVDLGVVWWRGSLG